VNSVGDRINPYSSQLEDWKSSRIEGWKKEAMGSFIQKSESEERFINSFDQDMGLWIPGCFCCTSNEIFHKMREKYSAQKLGILVPRDHDYFIPGENGFYRNIGPKMKDHFLFVAPELSGSE
jgi:hypothetical protein